jgi:hypothetical protein
VFAISDDISFSDSDKSTLKDIAKRYGFENFTFLVSRKASQGNIQYEAYTEVANQQGLQDIGFAFRALLVEIMGGFGSDGGRIDA